MKKLLTMIVMIAVLLLIANTALAMGFSKDDVPLMIAVNYIEWAENGFGVTNLRKDFNGWVDGEEEYSCVDDLTILDHPDEEQIQYIKLNYYDKSKDEEQQILRAMSMFAAIEYGAPGDWSDSQTLTAMAEAMSFYKSLEDVMANQTDQLVSGKVIPFYVSKKLTYVVTADKKEGIVIKVA